MMLLPVLLDSSAVRLFAIRDPSAELFNAWARDQGIAPVLSPITAIEILKAFRQNVFHSEAARRCSWVLGLENRHFTSDAASALMSELNGTCKYASRADLFEQKEIEDDLYLASLGQVKRSSIDLALQHIRVGQEITEDRSAEINSDPTLQLLRSAKSYPDSLSCFDLQSVARQVLEDVCFRHQISKTPDQLDRVLTAVEERPTVVPVSCGIVRVNMYSNWFAAKHGRLTGQDDLKIMIPALSMKAVITNDKRFLKRGQDIFPEVEWQTPTAELI